MSARCEGPIVIAYDGSPAADPAIDVAGRLLPGREALVVHVYESQYRDSRAVRALAHGEVGDIVQALDQALTDEATDDDAAGRRARAQAAGLDATGETIEALQGRLAHDHRARPRTRRGPRRHGLPRDRRRPLRR